MMTIAFIVHGGELEIKGALLACSLRQKCHPSIRRVAVIMQPEERWGAIAPETRAIMEKTGTQIVGAENRIDLDYPHGNKLTALSEIDGPALFLDSDMMMMRPFLTHYSLLAVDAAAKAADYNTFERGRGNWSKVYATFGMEPPEHRVVSTVANETMLPYYNAGFVYVRDGRQFAEIWLDTAQKIDANDEIEQKRPWLDQVAMPVAFERLGWDVGVADRDLNFPGHVQKLDGHVPYILHYHSPDHLLENPRAMQDVEFYQDVYPELRALFEGHEGWRPLVRVLPEEEAQDAPDAGEAAEEPPARPWWRRLTSAG